MNLWRRSNATIIPEAFLYLTLLATVLCFGGGFAGGYTLLQALTVGTAGLLFIQKGLFSRAMIHSGSWKPLLLLTVWFLFLLACLIPVPKEWVQRLSPGMAVLHEAFAPGGLHAGDKIALTTASYASKVEVGKLAAYTALFFCGYALIRSREALRRFFWGAVGLGVLLSAVGIVFYRINPLKAYGIFEFAHSQPMTPFLNKNQFANFLVMTIGLTLGGVSLVADRSSLSKFKTVREKVLWFASREATRFLIVTGLLIIQMAALFKSASRGGFVALMAVLIGFALFLALKGGKKGVAAAVFAALLIPATAGAAKVKWLVYKLRMMSEAPSEDIAILFRLSNWKDTLRIFFDFPLFGIGPGGFYEIFPMYKSLPEHSSVSQTRFLHAENEFVQNLAETGLIGSVLLWGFAAVLITAFLMRWNRIQSKTLRWCSLGAALACFGMGVHSLFDFPTHVPANMAFFAVLGGVLTFLIYEGLPPRSLKAPPVSSETLALAGVQAGGIFLMLLRTALVAGVCLLVFPPLYRQWASETQFLKAQKVLGDIEESGMAAPKDLKIAYTALLEAQKTGGGQARLEHALGQVYFYFGLTSETLKIQQKAWLEKGETAFQNAIVLDPFYAPYHFSLGQLYSYREQYEAAEPSYRHAATLARQNPHYRFWLGQAQIKQGNRAEARESFRAALAINHTFIEPVLQSWIEDAESLDPERFQELMPAGQKRERLWELTAFFFERRGKGELAGAIRALPLEPVP